MTNYLYLHGFASSPQSKKAEYLKERFQTEFNISLNILDLNQGDFSHFTLTRAITQSKAFLEGSSSPWVLIGSSLGGLISTLLAEQISQVERLILLAPAFDFLSLWSERLGKEQMQQWRESGYLSVYHHAQKKTLPLDYQFIADAQQYFKSPFQREIPTLILHGTEDETIPIEVSRHYAVSRPWVKLIELPSDHNLTNVLPEIWQSLKNAIPALS